MRLYAPSFDMLTPIPTLALLVLETAISFL